MKFGEFVASARKQKGLSQKELAGKIMKPEDGKPITPQYLNDIEHDRRNAPSGELLAQFAKVLAVSEDVLYGLAGRLPENIFGGKISPEKMEVAFKAFRKKME